MPTSRLKNSTTMMKMANGGRLQEDATSPKSLLEDPNCLILISRYGKVVDVYIAFKRTKKGSRFGFVRFMNVGEITMPPFEFPPISYLGNYQIPKTTKTMYDHSFKEAVTCTKTPMHSTHVNINIKEGSFIRSKLECCWSGKAKNIHVLQNAWDIMANNGLDDCKLKYVRGLSFYNSADKP
ncbi:hypothetical protein Tco_0835996 [Tanacetum coccineum]